MVFFLRTSCMWCLFFMRFMSCVCYLHTNLLKDSMLTQIDYCKLSNKMRRQNDSQLKISWRLQHKLENQMRLPINSALSLVLYVYLKKQIEKDLNNAN